MNIKLLPSLLLITTIIFAQENEKSYPAHTSSLYAPWREQYPRLDNSIQHQDESCPFCTQLAENNDEHHLILRRFDHNIVALNIFPYSKGHLLIIPKYHVRNIADLSKKARHELIDIIAASVGIIQTALKAPGANIGINLERVAGASIPDHLHIQIVPRRTNDSSFMNTIGNTSIICWDLKKLYAQLKPAFEKITL